MERCVNVTSTSNALRAVLTVLCGRANCPDLGPGQQRKREIKDDNQDVSLTVIATFRLQTRRQAWR